MTRDTRVLIIVSLESLTDLNSSASNAKTEAVLILINPDIYMSECFHFLISALAHRHKQSIIQTHDYRVGSDIYTYRYFLFS